ncbi:MAG: LysR family transcriptional regulator [Novosphingobium sp.]
MRFDLTDLRLFLAVVDAGSITHGAAEVGLSLPAASERLRDMEATGEVILLIRGRRGIAPTEAGEMLAHHARMILHQMTKMQGDIGQFAKGLRSWMAAHPQIDVDLKERESGEIARSVGAGFAEIGVLSSAVETDNLILRPFAIDRLVCVVSREHPLAGNGQVRFADLLGDQFIGMAGGALQDHIEGQASRLGTKMKMRVRLRSFQGICRMAGVGVGVGIIPESAAKRCQRSTRIAIIRLRDEWANRRLSLCVRDEAGLTPPAKALFDHLSKPV